MLKKTIKYTDYNGVEREEDFYFNLSKSELTEMEVSYEGGFQGFLKNLIDNQNAKEITQLIKDLILNSYGIKCQDGSFDKSPELSRKFSHTMAYDTLFMELMTNTDAATAFANGIIPADLLERAKEIQSKQQK